MEHEDISYLKRYVQNHPDNRMAWYLLGKQYMLEDKEAKANYCFLQAGSIYEAYERKQHPLAKAPKLMIADWNRKRRINKLLRRSAVIALLLLGITIINPFSSGNKEQEEALTAAVMEASDRMAVVFVKPATEEGLGRALGALIEDGAQSPAYGIAAMLEQEGNWRKWTGATRLLLSTQRQGSGEAFEVGMLDALACDCQPADATEAYSKFQEWSAVQEQRWTLRSAIIHYRELFKRWPEELNDMVRPYPNNVLAGETDYMKQAFAGILEEIRRSGAGGKSSQGDGKTGAGRDRAGQGGEALPDQPLSVVVDTSNYRLAVISGDVIVRSYPIGLGGEKTPSGSFYISEKVKNPNGKDDGEFGSRGMTLSGTRYAIHGTNEPDSIGKDESLGCVRMLREDVEELYDLVPLGTKVTIKNGVLPESGTSHAQRFQLQPMQDETNPAVIYRWL
ncbi:L,D-transpeptidase [Paenibacillus oenotherae]|uniref:L,D-transpeptidase n=1 Tax=Paenibacillus oenotherae TaxID=1435645 RepID=A0ABS7DEX9_9BACL|nr:L,D-transpeptidase [Paenibacillus oenotherae]MBW7477713.1 L,D-transpeptidase [Paenibacillus oenotherae]